MSEDFLTRWSRRKRQAAEAEKPVPEAAPARGEVSTELEPAGVTNAPPPFDSTSLPPIDSITALSDVTAFLREGVPAELTRAALRRVWTTDPAIRDFVGLAENAWDFTDPNAMYGFGPLESTDEVRRMIAGIVDRIGEAARAGASDPDASEISASSGDSDPAESASFDQPEPSSGMCAQDPAAQVSPQSGEEIVAAQHDIAKGTREPKQLSRRTHGSALPR